MKQHLKKCSHCGASEKNDIEDNIERLLSCTNCVADIKLKGGWTGDGYGVLTHMIKTYGIDTIRAHHYKMKLEKI